MAWKTNRILIVGGGSAGWMTAATLAHVFPNKQISILESPTFQAVGVGESTLGQIRVWMNLLGIDLKDFIKATNASLKLGIKFTDFYKKNSGSFFYPFGRPYFSAHNQVFGLRDWHIKKHFNPNLDVADYCRTYFPAVHLMEKNRVDENLKGTFDNFRWDRDVAFHFDAALFAQWLKNSYCKGKNVRFITADIKNILDSENGIDSLVLTNGKKLTADLFVDCTGWNCLLIGKKLKEPFQSYADILPNNRAWAVQIPYENKGRQLEPFTECTALGHGWAWNIPLWSRLGTGYVYSDLHCKPEVAKKEFLAYLVRRKIIKSAKASDHLQFNDLKMKVGLHQRTWVKNVFAIGMSAGFIEPLESNGLFCVHEFLQKAIRILDRPLVTQWDIDTYNMATKAVFDNFAEFVSLHYALSHRQDTNYWKDLSRKSFCSKMLTLEPTLNIGFFDLAQRKMFIENFDEHFGIHCIATGMQYPILDKGSIARWEFIENGLDLKDQTKRLDKIWIKQKKKWQASTRQSPTLLKYLQKYHV